MLKSCLQCTTYCSKALHKLTHLILKRTMRHRYLSLQRRKLRHREWVAQRGFKPSGWLQRPGTLIITGRQSPVHKLNVAFWESCFKNIRNAKIFTAKNYPHHVKDGISEGNESREQMTEEEWGVQHNSGKVKCWELQERLSGGRDETREVSRSSDMKSSQAEPMF